MLENSKSKMEPSTVGRAIDNAEVMIEGRESEFQPHELKFVIGTIRIPHPAGSSGMINKSIITRFGSKTRVSKAEI